MIKLYGGKYGEKKLKKMRKKISNHRLGTLDDLFKKMGKKMNEPILSSNDVKKINEEIDKWVIASKSKKSNMSQKKTKLNELDINILKRLDNALSNCKISITPIEINRFVNDIFKKSIGSFSIKEDKVFDIFRLNESKDILTIPGEGVSVR